MIAIIDYDAGNIKSVEKAIHYLGEQAVITRDRETILAADKVILPGVGAFGDAMAKIRSYGLEEVIHEVVDKGTPFLGICLGLQLLFESSEESVGVKGLGLLKGKIVKIPDDQGLKVPQIGWNSLEFPKESVLFQGINNGEYVYFVHSYYVDVDERYTIARCDYMGEFSAAIKKDNFYGVQFHPEKSGDVGEKILKNFMRL